MTRDELAEMVARQVAETVTRGGGPGDVRRVLVPVARGDIDLVRSIELECRREFAGRAADVVRSLAMAGV